MNDLYLLAINLTRRCNLACAHCYLDADTLANGSGDELSSAEVCALLDQVASRGRETMVVLTGGEPLVRQDLESIVAHGAALGLSMVVGSNGTMLTRRRTRALKRAGALGVGISLDSLDADHHDAFRGLKGTWRRTMAGIEACRSEALSFQLHFSVTDATARELPAMIDFARTSGARILNVFFLVCTGRGKSLSDISPARYEQVLYDLVSAQSRQSDLIIRARCAPHFKRIAFDRDPRSLLNRISGSEGDGCIAGSHYCRVTPEGNVTACPYIEDVLGNVRQRAFLDIWDHAPDLERLRQPVLRGKCGECEYQRLCGGCRARARARGEDLMAADPICSYTPRGGAVLVPLPEPGNDRMRWSQEAQNRLSRVPAFVRRLVRTRAEAYAAELGDSVVTTGHLSALTARRFGAARPPGRPQGVEHVHD